jgi:hypothetical protein
LNKEKVQIQREDYVIFCFLKGSAQNKRLSKKLIAVCEQANATAKRKENGNSQQYNEFSSVFVADVLLCFNGNKRKQIEQC